MGAGEGPQACSELVIGIRVCLGQALGRAMLPDDLASPSLREMEPFGEHGHRPASPRRA
jgi:hypothetical protein